MKTHSIQPVISTSCWRPVALLCGWLALWAGLLAPAASAASADEILERGIYLEETKGDLDGARQEYQKIAGDPSAERSLAAQAQLRLGLIELKLGNKPRAISALEQLTLEFPDKDKLLALLENHMPRLLDEILRQIEQNYIREVDRTELLQTALRAIVGKLDGGTGYLRDHDLELLTRNEVSQMNQGMEQKLAGIGARLRFDEATHQVEVESPLPNSPALRAGIRAGDHIVQVDGQTLPPGKELENAVRALRGPVGSPVTVGVRRAGTEELLTLQVVRASVVLPSVLGERYKPDLSWDFMLDEQKKIGYVRLTSVGKQSPEEMRVALEDLQTRGMKGLLLDLRNNPGGMLQQAVETADLFVENGRILTVKDRTGERHYDAHADGTFSGFPIVVLVNRKTASAAEIIAACLQDHERAAVLGERTYGQGIVRSLIDLKGGIGMLKMPVGAFYRPSGKAMNRFPDSKESADWGIRPNDGWEVILSDEEQKQVERARLERDKVKAQEDLSVPAPVPAAAVDRQLQQGLACLQTFMGRN